MDFLVAIHELELVGNVAPIQYAIRLLIPEGSRLLELPETHQFLDGFEPGALCYRWIHPDPRVDELQQRVFDLVQHGVGTGLPREEVFRQVCACCGAVGPAGVKLLPCRTTLESSPLAEG